MQALLAAKSLLQLTSDDAVDLQKFSGLDDSLYALRVQLDELTSHEERREYALEVEILRREVQIIVTGFGVDASSLDPGTSFRFEGRGRRGSVSHSRLDRVPV